jgi:hypothetical protein
MRINEVKQPSNEAINESVQRGEITEAVGNILKTHTANKWSDPMTAEQMMAENNALMESVLAKAS